MADNSKTGTSFYFDSASREMELGAGYDGKRTWTGIKPVAARQVSGPPNDHDIWFWRGDTKRLKMRLRMREKQELKRGDYFSIMDINWDMTCSHKWR